MISFRTCGSIGISSDTSSQLDGLAAADPKTVSL